MTWETKEFFFNTIYIYYDQDKDQKVFFFQLLGRLVMKLAPLSNGLFYRIYHNSNLTPLLDALNFQHYEMFSLRKTVFIPYN